MTALVASPRRFRQASQRGQSVALSHFRLTLLMLLFIGGTVAVATRLVWLAVFSDAAAVRSGIAAGIPPRGDIVDRNGVPLARMIDAWSIGIHPAKVIGDKRKLAETLARLMPERDADAYYQLLRSDLTFTYLRRRALPELVAAVNALGEPGIAFAREPERVYPQATLAAHVLGYLDIDGHGRQGMERVLDKRLTDPLTRGKPVALSIDSRVQAAMESELYAAMVKHSALGGTGIVLDVETGEVIAMASLPVFNPNRVGASPEDARRNGVTQSVYELGSTFKPLTVAAAMDSGVITSMGQRYDVSTPLQVGRFRIRDDHPAKGSFTIPEILVHSSNIGTARIADAMGQAMMEKNFRALGFYGPPDIELREKGASIVPSFWARTTVMTTAYGHGIAVTPLQLANAYATLVNGGIWRPTTLLRRDADKVPAGHRVYSEATSFRSRQLLRLIVEDGTGRKGDAPGFRVGGKTGTAEKPSNGGYNRRNNVSTFAAVFPMDAPRYVVIAMLDSPRGTADTFGFTTAAWTAAPVVKRVIERTGPMLGVNPDFGRDIDTAEMNALVAKKED
ncbi:peptidoglycan D,D-transpeptidase FtsI family protein [Sphingomonas flavalba]|uniref:peptidoglycan D,D-transpeptidase FtsI family protein n=1 Tax=Sphingomonas flavalba TaxID=2559804 RepID=UPI0039E1CA3B